MDRKTFDAFTRLAGQTATRRGVGALAAGVAGLLVLDHDAEGKKKKKKKKKAKCSLCGGVCCGDAYGSSCLLRGNGEEICVPNVRTCTAQDNKCDPANNGGLWCDATKNCTCFVTTAGAVACLKSGEPTSCGNCTRDADCSANFGPGSACVQAGAGCTTTGCTRGFCLPACPA